MQPDFVVLSPCCSCTHAPVSLVIQETLGWSAGNTPPSSVLFSLSVFFLSSSPSPPEFLFNLYSFSALLPLTWLHFSLLSRYIFKGSFNSCTTTGFCNSPVVEEHTVFSPIYLWKKLMCRDAPWFCLAPRQYQHWVPRCTGTGRALVPFTDLKPW